MYQDSRLSDLLPLRFEGGFRLEAFEDDCECGEPIAQYKWAAQVGWLSPACCVISLEALCHRCTRENSRRIRIRAQPEGFACLDVDVQGKWKTSVIGNITFTDRVKAWLFGSTEK